MQASKGVLHAGWQRLRSIRGSGIAKPDRSLRAALSATLRVTGNCCPPGSPVLMPVHVTAPAYVLPVLQLKA